MTLWRSKPALLWILPLPALVLILACAILAANWQGLPERSLARSLDAYAQINAQRESLTASSAPSKASTKVIIADIDTQSRKAFGRWPWPRTRYAEVIAKIQEGGAEVILLDEIFDEPDPTSPDQMLETWWNTPGLEDALEPLSRLPDHDAILARALRQGFIVTPFQLTQGKEKAAAAPKARFIVSDEKISRSLPLFSGMRSTSRSLTNAAQGYGAVNLSRSHDNAVRSIPLAARLGSEIYPSQLLEALRLWQKTSTIEIGKMNAKSGKGLNAYKVGSLTIPMSKDGSLILTASAQNMPQTISVADIIAGTASKDALQGALVILSASAEVTTPTYKTSLDVRHSGAEIRGQALQQIINQDFLTRVPWAPWAEAGVAVGLGILFIGLAFFVSLYWSAFFLVIESLFIIGLGWYGYQAYHLLFDAAGPIAALILTFIPTAFAVRTQSKAQQDHIRSIFGNYLSPSTVSSLAQDTSTRSFVGEKRETTILFGNIRDLRKLEEHYGNRPEDLTIIINEFLSEMTKHVHDTHGTVNRYIGDRIMAVWNAPLRDANHTQGAADCALKMVESLDRLNTRLEEKAQNSGIPFKQVELGIGIETGSCVTGIMGSRLRDEYSVIGQAVRHARRLNANSEIYGPAIIVGENAYTKIHHDYALLEVDYVEMPGRPHPARVFALMGNPVMKANPRYRALEKAHQAYFTAFQACDWDAALAVTQEARQMSGSIPELYDIYDRRVYFYQQNPPGEEWIGAHNQPVI